jgi:hypothetical protein
VYVYVVCTGFCSYDREDVDRRGRNEKMKSSVGGMEEHLLPSDWE